MLTRNVQLAFNQFAIDYANQNNIDLDQLLTRLTLVQTDSLATHIIQNYKTWRYALATRQLVSQIPMPLYTIWQYKNLLNGSSFTDVLFVPGVNEFYTSDLYKIIGIVPKGNVVNPDLCENKTVKATNGIAYIICVPFAVVNNEKVYNFPQTVKVKDGRLEKFPLLQSFGYKFIAEKKDEIEKEKKDETEKEKKDGNGKDKSNGNGTDEIIKGVDNKVLIFAGIGLLLLMRN